MKRAILILGIVLTAGWAAAAGQEAAEEDSFGKPIFEGGGIKVYKKVDFDEGANPFRREANGAVALEELADYVCSGRSLRVQRAKPEGYFGAGTSVAIKGSKDLKIGFCVRAKGMLKVSLNMYDQIRKDNTTPASPAQVQDDQWGTALLYCKDFWYNNGQPQRKISTNTKHTSMFFHGSEAEGQSGKYWIDRFIIYRGYDTSAPDPPGEVQAKPGESGKVLLTWKEAKDNAFAVVYCVYRKGAGKWEKVGEAVQTRYQDVVPKAGAYSYRVTACDFENNASKPSKDLTVTVKSAGEGLQGADDRVKDRLAYAANVGAIHAAGAGKVRRDVFLFAGDSITAADAYTFTLGSHLARGVTVRKGVGQMRTDFGKAQIEGYLAESRPEFAIVMYGTNDAKSAQAVTAAMENLAYVIDACAKRGTVPVLATIPPRGFSKEKQDGQERFNQALIKLCREKKVPISYCYEEMMQHELKEMLGDGVHLTAGPGNAAAGRALRKTFDQIYWTLRDTSASWQE